MIGQTGEQFRNQHGIISEHHRPRDTRLAAQTRAVHRGDFRDFAARTAGGRHKHQTHFAVVVCQMVDDVIDAIAAGDGDNLRHVHDGTAADCDNAGILELGSVGNKRIDHLIGRFLATVLVYGDHMGTVGDAGEERIMHHVHGDQQVVRAKIEFLRKFRDRGELVDHGTNGELLHTKTFFQRPAYPLRYAGAIRALSDRTFHLICPACFLHVTVVRIRSDSWRTFRCRCDHDVDMPLRDARFQGPRHAVWLVHAHAGRTDGPAIDTEDVMALTKKQTKQLRAMANQLNPLLWIGKNDVTDAAIKQADETIDKHELIKCAVQDGSGLTAREAADQLAQRLGADVVQVIGNRFVLYRESRRDDVKKIVLVRE